MNKNHRLSTVTSLQVGVDYQVHITIYAYYRGTDAQGYSIPCAKMHMQIHFKIELRARQIRNLIFPSTKFGPHAFCHQLFFLDFIRTSCYVKHITGNFCHLHSSSIMRAITGDLGRMQEEWGLSLGFATEVSTLAFLQYTVAESLSIPFMVEQRFCTAAHIKSAGKTNKKTWLLQRLLSFLQETDRWLY